MKICLYKSLAALSALALCTLLGSAVPANAQGIVADHNAAAQFDQIPREWIEAARQNFRISYAHTSHGQQISVGMGFLNDLNSDGLYSFYDDYHNTDPRPEGAMSFWDFYGNIDRRMDGVARHLETWGNPPAWVKATRIHLGDPAYSTEPNFNEGADRNLIIWSWCGGVSGASETNLQTNYLDRMNQLEQDFPDVTFIYMTGHLDGTNSGGNLHQRNEQIRRYCRENNKILFDFADIERYDPGGRDYLDLGGGGDSSGTGCLYNGGNWCDEWCTAHPDTCPVTQTGSSCYTCCNRYYCPHSEVANGCLNCHLKAQAFWWLLARLAGWNGGSVDGPPAPPERLRVGP